MGRNLLHRRSVFTDEPRSGFPPTYSWSAFRTLLLAGIGLGIISIVVAMMGRDPSEFWLPALAVTLLGTVAWFTWLAWRAMRTCRIGSVTMSAGLPLFRRGSGVLLVSDFSEARLLSKYRRSAATCFLAAGLLAAALGMLLLVIFGEYRNPVA